MTETEKGLIRMECAVKKLEDSTAKIEKIAIDVAVMKNQSRTQAIREFIHYGITTVAIGLGIKGNV